MQLITTNTQTVKKRSITKHAANTFHKDAVTKEESNITSWHYGELNRRNMKHDKRERERGKTRCVTSIDCLFK